MYNKERYIQRAINSVLNQTEQDIEIIVVDDGSTDNGAALCKDVILVRRTNGGAAAARNTGARLATSDFLAFLDADDEWHPGHLESLLNLRRQYPEAGMYTTAYRIGSGYAKYHGIPDTPRHFIITDYFKSATLGEFPVNASSFGISRSVYWKYGGFPDGEWWGEDAYLFGVIALDRPVAFCWDGEKCPFVWMGMWKTDLLRQFDYTGEEEPGKDIIISAEALMSYPIGYVEKAVYYKTIYHEKAQKYIKDDPFCHFTMYGTMLYRIAVSKHAKRKYLLVILIPASLVAVFRLYSAYLLFKLPLDHPIRKTVRRVVEGFK